MKEKGTLIYKKAGLLNEDPLSGEVGGSVEPLIPFLSLVDDIRVEVKLAENQVNIVSKDQKADRLRPDGHCGFGDWLGIKMLQPCRPTSVKSAPVDGIVNDDSKDD